MRYVLAFDQGTTSSRAILFDEEGSARSVAQREFRQIYPQPGWVEHDPKEILTTQYDVAREAVLAAGVGPADSGPVPPPRTCLATASPDSRIRIYG